MTLTCINSRNQSYILIICLFFFLNIYILYNTATTTQTVPENDVTMAEQRKIAKIDPKNEDTSCEITDELAISALKRVKSDFCRRKIEQAACDLKAGIFHDTFPESTCSNYDSLLKNLNVGCFADQKNGRLLSDFEYKLPKTNCRRICQQQCYRAGFLYYGLEYGQECFCGNKLTNATQIPEKDCQAYPCPGNEQETCGGFNAIDVYRTGLKKALAPLKPKFIVDPPKNFEKKAKILFLLQLNGRNERQVKRFLKSIYSPDHYYYVHVDKRQNYMVAEMQKVAEKLPNMIVSHTRFSTIWGGASLLQMFQQMIRDSLRDPKISDWDYIVNFSESDFPVLPLSDFENLINSNLGFSFLASHGYNTGRFIQKQGFEFVFLECEERMWRIGKRAFPENVRIDGGSDWVGIERGLAEYSISDEELPSKMRKLFESVLLPLESFYHTLSQNSQFCDKVMASNLRLTNWYRKQGCRCAGLKKVVDWCGCSPLVFRNETMPKFSLEKVRTKPSYFARKFDSMVNIDAISEAEQQSVPKSVEYAQHPSYSSAFANIYAEKIDGESKKLRNFAKSLKKLAKIGGRLEKLERIDAFRRRNGAKIEIVTEIVMEGGEKWQILVDRKHNFEIFEKKNVEEYLLKNMTFGTRFEYKEELCREYMGIITKDTTIQIKLEWQPSKDHHQMRKSSEKTSPEIEIVWRRGDGEILETHKVKQYDSVFGGQFDELNLKKFSLFDEKSTKPVTCDDLSADVMMPNNPDGQPIGTIHFPVYPEESDGCHEKLVDKYFKIIDSCKNEECDEKVWSTAFPDPKSDILYGYDTKKQIIY